MRRRLAIASFSVASLAAAVGCSQSSSPVAPISGPAATSAPTSIATLAPQSPTPFPASPTPSRTATPVPTATPTLSPTATPTAAPTISSISALDCTSLVGFGNGTLPSPLPLPGTYTEVITEGNVNGSVYSQVQGSWSAIQYTTSAAATPTPVAIVTATPTPAPSATIVTYKLYAGTYTVPAFSVSPSAAPTGTSAGARPFAQSVIPVNATTGCAFLIIDASGPVGIGPSSQPINTEAIGIPYFGNGTLFTSGNTVASGSLTSFSLTNLAASTGSGSFVLDVGVTGTINLFSETTISQAQAERLRAIEAQRRRGFAL